MSISWELRWFYPGDMPQAIDSWFEGIGDSNNITHEDTREDYQIPLPGCDYLGIKLREKRLEIKWRKKNEGFSLLDGMVKGSLENWAKWGWAADPGFADSYGSFAVEGPQGPTVRIAKKRSVRRYQVLDDDDNERLRPVRWVEGKSKGCSIEVTGVESMGRQWWSVAFETFGTEEKTLLQTTAEQLLSSYQGPLLTQENSFGYPRWIGSFART